MQQTQQQATKTKYSSEKNESNSFAQIVFGNLRNAVLNSIKAILLSAVVLLGIEGIFAAAHIGEETVVKPDALLGYTHMENKSITYRQEGFSSSKTNKYGFRDREYPLAKADGTTRIAVLGDSMTVGMEVPQDKTFCKLLEQRLNSDTKNRFEVMNCGFSGFGTGQEYLVYKQKVEQFHPDILVVTYNYGDSDDNVFQRAGMNPPRPVFRDEQGVLKVDWQDINKWYASNDARFYASFEWLRRNSRVLAVLNKLNLDLSNADPLYQTISSTVGKPIAYLWAQTLSFLPPANSNLDSARSCFSSPTARTNSATNDSVNYATANEFQKIFLANKSKTEVALSIFHALNNDCIKNNCKLVIAFGPALTNSMFYYRELNDISKQADKESYSVIRANQSFPPREPMEISPNFFGLHFSRAGHQIMSNAIYNGIFASKSPEKRLP